MHHYNEGNVSSAVSSSPLCPLPTIDHVGECLDSCDGAGTCSTCTARAGCGWCHATARCTAGSGGVPLASTCPFGYALGQGSCSAATCPGAVNNVGLRSEHELAVVHAFCNDKGTCDYASGRCTCDKDRAGAACELTCNGAKGKPCSDRGMCNAADGRCFCKPGFRGVDCNDRASDATCECGVRRIERTREVRRCRLTSG